MKYNIIGDIHGRTIWRDLIVEDAINIIVGDYFSPYDLTSFAECKKIFLEIVEMKKADPEHFILLVGNHDLDHWVLHEHYSRYDYENAKEIARLFEENKDCFTMAYSINDMVLVTHAGVTADWYWRTVKGMGYDEFAKCMNDNMESLIITPSEAASDINEAFARDVRMFNFRDHASGFDCYGDSSTQSCVWIRPLSLIEHDLFRGRFVQVFGHTQAVGLARITPSLFMIDCLGSKSPDSLIIETGEDGMDVSSNKGTEILEPKASDLI